MNVAYVSPIATAMLIVGIFMLVLPPLGMLLIVGAIVTQVRYRKRVTGPRNAARAAAHDRRFNERVAAARSLP